PRAPIRRSTAPRDWRPPTRFHGAVRKRTRARCNRDPGPWPSPALWPNRDHRRATRPLSSFSGRLCYPAMANYSVYELLNGKRSGEPLEPEEIEFFVDGFTRGLIPEYQMSAFLMAVAINGMNADEMATLTQAMLRSGEQWHLRDSYDFIADKHSTGGVGDKVSLVLSPWVAACGIKIGMLSGRGLGHTGGTLDKLEAIPRFNARLSRSEFERAIDEALCVISTSTEGIAPADKKIYA